MREGYDGVPGCRGYFARPLPVQAVQEGGSGFLCFLAYIEPGGGGPENDHAHDFGHFITVFRGTLLVKQGQRQQLLHGPEAIAIPGGLGHSIWNAGQGDLELLVVDIPAESGADMIAEAAKEMGSAARRDAGGSAKTGAAAKARRKSGVSESKPDKKELVRMKKEELVELIREFSDRHLDEEYKGLCTDIAIKLSRKREPPILHGRIGIWAGGIIHAIGSINFLFDPGFEPHVSAEDLAAYFGASNSAVYQRSSQIREMFKIDQFNEKYTTSYVKSLFPSFFYQDMATLEQRVRKAQESLEQSLRQARKRAMSRTASRGAFDHVYQFKVELLECEPKIWRRIQVPGHYSFWDLHVAIQDAMGWLDYHLHYFKMPRPGEREAHMIGIPDPGYIGASMDGSDIVVLAGWDEKIEHWFSLENRIALYEYDLGDSWLHGIILEKIIPREEGVEYPRCLAGARACPPEDCGGAGGYAELLALLAGPDCEERRELIEWLEEPFDPEEFSLEELFFDDPDERFLLAFSG